MIDNMNNPSDIIHQGLCILESGNALDALRNNEQFQVGYCGLFGFTKLIDFNTSIRLLESSANSSNALAACTLGTYYGHNGEPEKEMEYVKRAADMGNPFATGYLGYLYYKSGSTHLGKAYMDIARWGKDHIALIHLARLYAEPDTGVNNKISIGYLEECANDEFTSEYSMGVSLEVAHYYHNRKDYVQALKYWIKAYELGYIPALRYIVDIADKSEQYSSALEFLKQAIEYGPDEYKPFVFCILRCLYDYEKFYGDNGTKEQIEFYASDPDRFYLTHLSEEYLEDFLVNSDEYIQRVWEFAPFI